MFGIGDEEIGYLIVLCVVVYVGDGGYVIGGVDIVVDGVVL